MHEIVVNLHMHTIFSDGTGSHHDLARAALRCGLDAIIVTDHNVWVGGAQRYMHHNNAKLLVLIGEEIHDRSRQPQKDHLLVFGAGTELAGLAEDMRSVIKEVRRVGGLAFAAHAVDPAAAAFREPDISWEDWTVAGLSGIELWNGFSELKSHIPTWFHGIFYAFFPPFVAHGPIQAAIHLWDRLLAERSMVAIGGSDAHALRLRAGLLERTIFPYDYHFRAVNTHVLLDQPLTGDAEVDARAIYAALAAGRCFIGYDLPRSTRGFRFSAEGRGSQEIMGGQIEARGDVTLHAALPASAEITLLRNGRPVHMVRRSDALDHPTPDPGVYRIEAHCRYLGRRRAWILSNPIYVR